MSATTYLYAQRTFNAGTSRWVDTAGTYLGGNVLSQSATDTKNGADQYSITTTTNYVRYDSAQEKLIIAARSWDFGHACNNHFILWCWPMPRGCEAT